MTLRAYQLDLIDRVAAEYAAGKRAVLLQLAWDVLDGAEFNPHARYGPVVVEGGQMFLDFAGLFPVLKNQLPHMLLH